MSLRGLNPHVFSVRGTWLAVGVGSQYENLIPLSAHSFMRTSPTMPVVAMIKCLCKISGDVTHLINNQLVWGFSSKLQMISVFEFPGPKYFLRHDTHKVNGVTKHNPG